MNKVYQVRLKYQVGYLNYCRKFSVTEQTETEIISWNIQRIIDQFGVKEEDILIEREFNE